MMFGAHFVHAATVSARTTIGGPQIEPIRWFRAASAGRLRPMSECPPEDKTKAATPDVTELQAPPPPPGLVLDVDAAREYDRRILESIARWQPHGVAAAASEGTAARPPDRAETKKDTLVSLSNCTLGARQLVIDAQAIADRFRHEQLTVIHILARLLALTPVQELLREAGADPVRALATAEAELAALPQAATQSYVSRETLRVLNRATEQARGVPVSLAHLLDACILAAPRATLDDLDREGVRNTIEEQQLNKVIAAGNLDRVKGR
jgi:hypothetical protein